MNNTFVIIIIIKNLPKNLFSFSISADIKVSEYQALISLSVPFIKANFHIFKHFIPRIVSL